MVIMVKMESHGYLYSLMCHKRCRSNPYHTQGQTLCLVPLPYFTYFFCYYHYDQDLSYFIFDVCSFTIITPTLLYLSIHQTKKILEVVAMLSVLLELAHFLVVW